MKLSVGVMIRVLTIGQYVTRGVHVTCDFQIASYLHTPFNRRAL